MSQDSIIPIKPHVNTPKEGFRSLQYTVDLSNGPVIVDLIAVALKGQLSQIPMMFVDNADNNFPIRAVMEGTLQRIVIPANSQGYINLLLPNSPRVAFASDTPLAALKVNFLNFQVKEMVWSASTVAYIPLLPEPANTLLAGPASGADANPTFRKLVTADLNSIAGQIPGTQTNDNAAAGNVGEYISATLVQATSVALTSGVTSNIISIALTAGDWDVTGIAGLFGAGTTVTSITAAINNVSATLPNVLTDPNGTYELSVPYSVSNATVANISPKRFLLAAPATIYLMAQGTFSGGGLGAWGTIRARRVR